MLIKTFAVISAVMTALNVILTPLASQGAALLWIVPLKLLIYFLALNVAYAIMIFVGTELTIKLDKPQEKQSKFWGRNLEAIADWLCMYGRVKVHYTGAEKLPEGRFLMVCNHRSYFDPIVKIPIFKSVDLNYVSKQANFKIPIGGKLMHAYGCLALDRENNREALKTVKKAAEMINNDEASICIYPEGTRSRKDELLPFHAGSFKIAQKTGVPVVVVTLYGTDAVPRNFPLRKTDVYVDVTDVIDAQFVKEHSTRETAEIARETIQKKYDEFREKATVRC